MNIYTAFCQQTNGRGTIWISPVKATDEFSAVGVAQIACAEDWNYDPEDVHVLGIAEGDVKILMWKDVSE